MTQEAHVLKLHDLVRLVQNLGRKRQKQQLGPPHLRVKSTIGFRNVTEMLLGMENAVLGP